MPKHRSTEQEDEVVSWYDQEGKHGRKVLEQQDAAFRLALRSVMQADELKAAEEKASGTRQK